MSKPIIFNAFIMNCASHQTPGLWAHPRNQSWKYKDIEYWIDLAKIAESGYFAAIFIADVIGYYNVYGGDAKTAVKNGTQIPVNDPLQLAAPIAYATKHIGIGVTASTSFEHPYVFARRLATADQRIGWNIVTSAIESSAHNVGKENLIEHDERYDIADEYLRVIYKLLEGSWEEDAVLRDREKRVFTNPDKVHEIRHKGKYFEVSGIGLTEPSPQRTPVVFQAGTSEAGKKFASKHAEAVFVSTSEKHELKEYVADIRKRAADNRRDPNKLLVFALITIVVDETDEKAQAKLEEYQKYTSIEGALTLLSGWTGSDLSRFKLSDSSKKIEIDANTSSSFANALIHDDTKERTIEDAARWIGIGGPGHTFVGSAKKVANELQEWVEETDVDGFNVAYAVSHETFEDIVKYLVPELQKRGVYPTSYNEGTLRKKLFGYSKLPDTHPAARYRDIEKVKKRRRKMAKKRKLVVISSILKLFSADLHYITTITKKEINTGSLSLARLISKLQKHSVYPSSYKNKIFGYKYLSGNLLAALYLDMKKIAEKASKLFSADLHYIATITKKEINTGSLSLARLISKLQKHSVYPSSYKNKIFGYKYLSGNLLAALYRYMKKVADTVSKLLGANLRYPNLAKEAKNG